MYDSYKTVAAEAIVEKGLSNAEVHAIYRYVQLRYRVEDVKSHAKDMLDNGGITKEQYNSVVKSAELLAIRFLTKLHDCNLAENDVFVSMIADFVSNC